MPASFLIQSWEGFIPMNFNADDERYLVKSIKNGEALLILGAGASFSGAGCESWGASFYSNKWDFV